MGGVIEHMPRDYQRVDPHRSPGHGSGQRKPHRVRTGEGDGRRQMIVNYSSRIKPSALLVIDMIVHRDSFPGVQVQSVVHASLAESTTLAEAQAGLQFVVDEDVTPLGRADTTNLAEFPQYRALLHHAAAKAGWKLEEFDVFRLQMAYPIMGAVHRTFFFDPLR